ncbi:MAG: glutaredoxin 3 [Thermodesulfobacteriota bacterium]|nr:glutaredoxin 3 [Thermodesulfobacteriota bacterium]
MTTVDIYSSAGCPYCVKAKQLLDKKNVSYNELRVDQIPRLAEEAVQRSGGRRTVPQIFINETHVGGCDELYSLEKAGRLDGLLGMNQKPN